MSDCFIWWSQNDDEHVNFSDDDTTGDHADGANDGVGIGDDACDNDVVGDDVQGLMPKDLGKTVGHIWGDIGNVGWAISGGIEKTWR